MRAQELTPEEVKDEFLAHVAGLIKYWNKTNESCEDKVIGIVHSILCTLDGVSAGMPSWILAPSPHPDDKVDAVRNEYNYYPENDDSEIKSVISGSLHDELRKYI